VRVGPKGQVVVPKKIRDRLGIRRGQRVRVSESGGEVRVRRLTEISELRGIFKDGPGRGLEDLAREHRREIESEEADTGRWSDRQD